MQRQKPVLIHISDEWIALLYITAPDMTNSAHGSGIHKRSKLLHFRRQRFKLVTKTIACFPNSFG